MKSILSGKVKTIDLNSHRVRVIAPRKLIDYDKGVKEVNKILKRITKI